MFAPIDAHAWMISLPVLLALGFFQMLPVEHPLRQGWYVLCRLEREWLGPAAASPTGRPTRWQRRLLAAGVAALALATLLSMARFVGLG